MDRVKNAAGELAAPFQELAQYIGKRRLLCVSVAVMIALVYGKQAFSADFYVDAEVMINNPHTVYNWDQIGRFGLIALKLLCGGNWYNPYFEGILFLCTLWLLGMALGSFFETLRPGAGEGTVAVAVLMFLAFPTFADQFMFRFQSFEIAAAMFMVVMASKYFYRALTLREYHAYTAAVMLDVFAFGIYQSMVNLQICFYIALYLSAAASGTGAKDRRRLVRNAAVQFLSGFAAYELIAQVFFGGGSYLEGQIGWLSGDAVLTVRNILAYVKRILLAMNAFYPVTYPVCVCGCLVFLGWVFGRERGRFVPFLLGIGSLLASPFFLALVTGTPSPFRAQCMLPFVCAVAWLFLTDWVKAQGRSVCHALCTTLGCVLLLCQISALMRLFYTQDVIRDADKITSVQIMERVHKLGIQGQGKPLVFAGHLGAKTNGACYTKDEAPSFLAYSLYEFAYVEGVPVETPDYFNTGRILGYYGTLGFTFAMPSVEMAQEAASMSAGMPSWPAPDSVREMPGYVLVKLGE